MHELKIPVSFAAIAIALIAGCSSYGGFSRGLAIDTSELEAMETSEQIEEITGIKSQLNFPFKLGVYIIGGEEGSGEKMLSDAMLGKENEFQGFLSELRSENIISEIITIPTSLVKTKDSLNEIRVAAARLGADAVLVINSLDNVDRYSNWASIFYVTIIGFWIIPGTNVDAVSIVQGIMFDVHNGYLYLSLESKGREERIGPEVLLRSKEVLSRARNEAALKFLEKLKMDLKELSLKLEQ